MATKQKVQLLMPEMGESVTEGTVLEWHVSEGDSVEEGQTMVEVSTDKVDAEVPAPASGTVTKIMVQVDDEIEVGKPMAEIDPNGGPPEAEEARGRAEGATRDVSGGEPAAEEATAESNGAGAEAPSATDAKATTDDASVSAGKELEGGGLEIVMPEMGESVTEGTVLEWHVSEGDQIAEGDTVVEVSTDKVDAEVPAPASRDDHEDPGRARRDRRGRQAARRDDEGRGSERRRRDQGCQGRRARARHARKRSRGRAG